MPDILLVDLSDDTYEPYGPFAMPADAHASAERSGFSKYALWEGGVRIALVNKPVQANTPGLFDERDGSPS